MTVGIRQAIERAIARKTIAVLLATGFTVSVDDGESITLKRSTDKKAILAAMFTTDEDVLRAYKNDKQFGWVKFVYGNDGYDVVSDNTVNLEEVLAPVSELADKIENGNFYVGEMTKCVKCGEFKSPQTAYLAMLKHAGLDYICLECKQVAATDAPAMRLGKLGVL